MHTRGSGRKDLLLRQGRGWGDTILTKKKQSCQNTKAPPSPGGGGAADRDVGGGGAFRTQMSRGHVHSRFHVVLSGGTYQTNQMSLLRPGCQMCTLRGFGLKTKRMFLRTLCWLISGSQSEAERNPVKEEGCSRYKYPERGGFSGTEESRQAASRSVTETIRRSHSLTPCSQCRDLLFIPKSSSTWTEVTVKGDVWWKGAPPPPPAENTAAPR